MSGSPQDMESNHAMECKFQANKLCLKRVVELKPILYTDIRYP